MLIRCSGMGWPPDYRYTDIWRSSGERCRWLSLFGMTATELDLKITNLPSQRAAASQASAEPIGPKRFCLCRLEAVRRITQKEGANKGKAFYKCPKAQNEQCAFFEVCLSI